MGLDLRRPDGRFRGTLALVSASHYAGLAADCAAFLSPQEAAYHRSLAFERRRMSYLLGRYAAKRAAGALLCEPDGRRLAVVPGIFGQPVLRASAGGGLGIGISISHSDEIACAVAFPEEHPMAVDVEGVAADRIPVIAGELTAAESALGLGLFPDPSGEALRHTVLWTAKEALSKTLRCGQMTPFAVFETQALARCPATGAPVPDDVLFRSDPWQGRYRHFGQYKFRSWADDRSVLTLALPRRTELQFALLPPGAAP